MAIHSARIGMLRDQLEAGLLDIPGSRINGSLNSRLYNSTNIRFEGVDADAVIATLKDIVLSNGSACSSHSIEPSHVLTAMGLNSTEAISSLRLSLSKYNTLEEISATIPRLDHLIRQLREMA
jgi:cysteine desulfurase